MRAHAAPANTAWRPIHGCRLAVCWPFDCIGLTTALSAEPRNALQLLEHTSLQPTPAINERFLANINIAWQRWITATDLLRMHHHAQGCGFLFVAGAYLHTASVQHAYEGGVSPDLNCTMLWQRGRSLAVHGLPKLECKYIVPLPLSEGDSHLAAGKAHWSATGSHFAVMWDNSRPEPRSPGGHPVFLITTHEADSGSMLGTLDVMQQLGWQPWCPLVKYCGDWSPAGSPQLLLSELDCEQYNCSPTAILELDASHTRLDLAVAFLSIDLGWSGLSGVPSGCSLFCSAYRPSSTSRRNRHGYQLMAQHILLQWHDIPAAHGK